MLAVLVTKMELHNLEQRVAIKFCPKLSDSAIETYGKILKVYIDNSHSCAQVFRWYKEFEHGCGSVKDKPRSQRPGEVQTDANVQCVGTLICQDHHLTI